MKFQGILPKTLKGMALTASPFCQTPGMPAQTKGTKKSCPNIRPPRLGSAYLRSGIHPWVIASGWLRWHLLSMTAAAPQRATRSPRMNASTQPSVTGPVDQNHKQPRRPTGRPIPGSRRRSKTVGASLLAMVVNDDAASLNARGGLRFFVGTPLGAGSLLCMDSPHTVNPLCFLNTVYPVASMYQACSRKRWASGQHRISSRHANYREASRASRSSGINSRRSDLGSMFLAWVEAA